MYSTFAVDFYGICSVFIVYFDLNKKLIDFVLKYMLLIDTAVPETMTQWHQIF